MTERPRFEFKFASAFLITLLSTFVALCPISARAQSRDYVPPNNDPYAPRSINPYNQPQPGQPQYGAPPADNPGYGQPYSTPPNNGYRAPYRDAGPPPQDQTFSSNEIVAAGHHFFGNVSEGLAKVVEYAFHRNGRPTGYILGQEGGGAVVAGLRYGEGVLYTKMFPPRKIYWQGPSLGYDFGADGSKTMTLVYNMADPSQVYDRFGGVEGSAYLVGGVGITFLTSDTLTLAPIRSGLGLRLGANIGYLKYTPSPTWNPF